MKCARFSPTDSEGRSNNSVCNSVLCQKARWYSYQVCSYPSAGETEFRIEIEQCKMIDKVREYDNIFQCKYVCIIIVALLWRKLVILFMNPHWVIPCTPFRVPFHVLVRFRNRGISSTIISNDQFRRHINNISASFQNLFVMIFT